MQQRLDLITQAHSVRVNAAHFRFEERTKQYAQNQQSQQLSQQSQPQQQSQQQSQQPQQQQQSQQPQQQQQSQQPQQQQQSQQQSQQGTQTQAAAAPAAAAAAASPAAAQGAPNAGPQGKALPVVTKVQHNTNTNVEKPKGIQPVHHEEISHYSINPTPQPIRIGPSVYGQFYLFRKARSSVESS